MGDHYHHGNLRQTLINTGIKIMNEKGEEGLSLRKVAAECGVSHAAPYAHFQDKEALLDAMKESVTNQLTEELNRALTQAKDQGIEEQIILIGREYVRFFIHNPDYFNFLFYKQTIQAHLSFAEEHDDDYAPFLMFKKLFLDYMKQNRLTLSMEQMEIELIRIWVVVQGLSSLASMKNVHCSQEWNTYLDTLIK